MELQRFNIYEFKEKENKCFFRDEKVKYLTLYQMKDGEEYVWGVFKEKIECWDKYGKHLSSTFNVPGFDDFLMMEINNDRN